MTTATAASGPDRPVLLRTRALRITREGPPLDLDFKEGEIVGLAGLEGHGQDDFLRSLCGLSIPAAGHVESLAAGGDPTRIRSLHDAARAGIYYLPRERKTQGIFPSLSILDNFSMATLRTKPQFCYFERRAQLTELEKFRKKHCIKYPSASSLISSLSGGNQQKVLIARLVACSPKVMLLNDPTRGVDIKTKDILYDYFIALAKEQGIALVFLSTEIEEILRICDRALVFYSGGLFREMGKAEMNRASVIAAMFGRKS